MSQTQNSAAQPWLGKAFTKGWQTLAGGTITVREPATGAELTQVGRANAEDIAQAAASAKEAQRAWAALSYQERASVFRRAVTVVEQRIEEFADWIVRETGAIRPKAMFELTNILTHFHEAAAMPSQQQGIVLPSEDGVVSLARRVPHGVVGIISPFNFPLLLSNRSVAPALAAGNAVVLKPDPRTPVAGGMLLAIIYQEAGLPEGVFQVLPGDADAGEALCTDPNIAMVSFTGSTAVGRRVGELAGRNLKKVALELGGKNSLIILDDADLDLAASNGAWASWLHQGQICMSAGRHLVHRKVADAYVQRMAEKARALPVGDPFSQQVALGPLITEKQVERVRRLVDDSVAQGAKLEAGGKSEGNFFHPTVLSGVTSDMPVFREEIFGPVVSVTVFDTDEEAIALANDTEYGLSAGVITNSVGRGMSIARQLNVGLVHVNDQTVNDNGLMPMGGRGASGNGSRHGGPANWDEFTQWQWTTYRDTAPQYPL